MQPVLVSQGIAGFGMLVLLIASAVAFRAFGNARLLAEAAPTPLRALTEGLHEVAGLLRGAAEIRAPLTGRSCAYYRLMLEQRRRNRWEPVLDQRDAVGLQLEDDTGTTSLALDDADVVVSSPDRVRTGIFAVPSQELDALLAKVGATTNAPTGPFLRWREEVLVTGDRVFAIGNARREEGEVWSMSGAPTAALMVSDREEAEVVRHQRRAGQRWAGIAAVALMAVAYGAWGLLG